MNSIFIFFDHFNNTFFYGNEDIFALEEIQSTKRTKKLTKIKELKVNESGEYLSDPKGKK